MTAGHWGSQINSPVSGIPYPDARVQTSRRNFLPVKGNGVDLGEMAGQCAQALALTDTPYLGGGVVGP